MGIIAYIATGLILLAILAHLVDLPTGEQQEMTWSPAEKSLSTGAHCRLCDGVLIWVDCWKCNPEDDDDCDICGHDGGWFVCAQCQPELMQEDVA